MKSSNEQPDFPVVADRWRVFFRRSEQPLIAVLMLASFAGIAFYYWHQSAIRNGLIDIDNAGSFEAEFRADINSSTWPELANLPGIGEKLAKTIVEHRNQNGPFDCHESLTDVDGIGPVKLVKIKRFLIPTNASPIARAPSE